MSVELAKDSFGKVMQITHYKTADAITLAASSVNSSLAASGERFVIVTPTASQTYINTGTGISAPGDKEGLCIPYGASITLVIRKGESIGTFTEVQICPLGEE